MSSTQRELIMRALSKQLQRNDPRVGFMAESSQDEGCPKSRLQQLGRNKAVLLRADPQHLRAPQFLHFYSCARISPLRDPLCADWALVSDRVFYYYCTRGDKKGKDKVSCVNSARKQNVFSQFFAISSKHLRTHKDVIGRFTKKKNSAKHAEKESFEMF